MNAHSRSAPRRLAALLALVTLLAAGLPALAQINPARVRGTVTDEAGNPVGKLTILLEPVTGARSTQKLKVSKKGTFMVAYFPSGTYKVSLEEGSEWFLKSLAFTVKEPSGILMNEGAAEAHPEKGLPEFTVIAGSRIEMEFVVTDADYGVKLKQQIAAHESRDEVKELLDLYDAGENAAVVARADALLASRPDFGSAHQLRGMALARLGRQQEAESALRRAYELLPDQASIKGALGSTLLERGKAIEAEGDDETARRYFDEAAAMFAGELAHEPGNVSLMTNRAIALDRAGREADAIAALESLIAASPTTVAAYFRLASLHRAAGENEKALEVLSSVPAGSPEAAKAIYNVAAGLYNDQQYQSALVALNKAIEIDPALGPAYRLRGYVHLATGDSASGGADLRKGLELDPDHAEAEQDRAILESLGG